MKALCFWSELSQFSLCLVGDEGHGSDELFVALVQMPDLVLHALNICVLKVVVSPTFEVACDRAARQFVKSLKLKPFAVDE